MWLLTQPDVVWTNSNAVPTRSAGASSVWDNSSDKLMVISGCTTFQPPTSHSNPFCLRSFLVPLWLMCLTLHMLPLRQQQLTASFTPPQVPKMTQSNRIRVRVWGGGCFCACVWGHRRNIHEVVCFFGQFMSEEKKGAASSGGLMPWQSCCCEKQDWRGWDRDLRGWFIAICHNGICAQSWNLSLGSALIKPVGVKPYYSAVTCQKTSHVPQWDYIVLYLAFH